MKTIIGICGTTSVGKSAVAVRLAKLMHTEIVSADSMQIYKGMDIGTAKINDAEKDGIKHHMIDIVEPNCNYSSFLYQEQASRIIDNMTTCPIVAGGTGFYINSLLYPPEFDEPDAKRKQELRDILNKNGIEYLLNILRKLDEKTYEKIDRSNPARVLRAVEIAETGVIKSDGHNNDRKARYNCILFVLQRNRASLYEQIDKRVDKMIEKGLVAEVEHLIDRYGILDTSAFSAIGYKEIIEFLTNKISLQDAVVKIKANTRHYAKRQVTYFKKMDVTQFIDVDNMSVDEVADSIFTHLQENYSIN